jgi:hypothetical protein
LGTTYTITANPKDKVTLANTTLASWTKTGTDGKTYNLAAADRAFAGDIIRVTSNSGSFASLTIDGKIYGTTSPALFIMPDHNVTVDAAF